MLLGRNVALWLGLVQAILSVLVGVVGVALTLQQVALIEALASAIIAILANANTPGAVPTFSLRTHPDGSSSRDLR